MLMLHVRSLDKESLALRIYEEEKAMKFPGLIKETEEICVKLEIECVHTTRLDAKKYRQIITEALHKENEKRIKHLGMNKTKCKRIYEEKYGAKQYLKEKNIEQTRFHYKARFGMLDFAGNYGGDRRFSKSSWLCRCKMENENEAHLLSGQCKAYGPIREKYGNLDCENDLVEFFSEVLKERERLEEEEEREIEEEMRRSPSGEGIAADAASGGPRPSHAGLGAEGPS